jgi:2-polyprenyl-3-methyl-5-hydroxy-6-metoxy-1,4-benzoquinol methylase
LKLKRRDFDLEFFRRFYLDPKTAAVSREDMTARAQFIAAFADYLEIDVRRVLDAGCGLGLMRPTFRRMFPKARYVGLEVSADMCAKYGWTRGSVDTWRSARRFDVVICYDVLQYLSARRAEIALANLARHCRGLLYFSALTREDWLYHCDRTRTDPDVHMRPAAWYRRRLRRKFHEAGAGLWVRKGAPITLWSLEYVHGAR